MDFVDGVSVCSDCGSTLVNKEEYFAALEAEKAKKAEEDAAEKRAILEAAGKEIEKLQNEDEAIKEARREELREIYSEPAVYETKAEKYADNKSSATAFLLVGIGLAAFSVALWTGVVKLGMIFNVMMTVFAVACFVVAIISMKKAKATESEIVEEQNTTENLIEWFMQNVSKEEIESHVGSDLAEEEKALTRLAFIKDTLIENFNVEKTYADMLSEEIYTKLYES